MTEYDNEPIPGLPGMLPPGERIVWQGSPDWRILARTAFHTRLIGAYFTALIVISLAHAISTGNYVGVQITVILSSIGFVVLHVIAWGAARTTMYTLTNRRIVLRVGIAVPKCINLPLGKIASVDFAGRADGTGDLPLTLLGTPRLGYGALWPHARPLRIVRPQPMLRAVPDGAKVAALVARACLAANPDGRMATIDSARPAAAMPASAQAHAA